MIQNTKYKIQKLDIKVKWWHVTQKGKREPKVRSSIEGQWWLVIKNTKYKREPNVRSSKEGQCGGLLY